MEDKPSAGRAIQPPARPRPARGIAAAVAALSLLTATACTSAPAGPAASPAAGPSQPGSRTGPAPLRVLKRSPGQLDGDIFTAPQAAGRYASGPEIISPAGRLIWFHAVPAGEVATDFRTQTYRGQPVLTWFQSTGHGRQPGGTDYIYNDRYQQIAAIRAGHGYATNFHEFLITPWNTALITADAVTTANLTSIGGPADQKVIDDLVQEIDIRTGRVLFQWNSADHVPYSASEVPRPGSAAAPWDWFHINAVHLDTDGNLLVSSRFTWTTYKVSRRTGEIIWELGGKHSTFRLRAAPGQVLDQAGEIFAFQHDPEAIGHDEYTFFDDESDGRVTLLHHSRVVTVKLDLATKMATLVKSVSQPEGLVASATGNAQTLSNGDLFVSWGDLPYLSEFSPSGKLLFNAEFPPGISSYRSYLQPWHPAS